MSSDEELPPRLDGADEASSHEEVEEDDDAELEEGGAGQSRVRHKRSGVASELDPEKLKAFEEAERRRGVVYVSRIPPFMKPVKLRHMLEQFAKIGRVYLAPEGAL